MDLTAAAPARGWLAHLDRPELVARLTSTPLIPVAIAVALGLLFIGDKSFWLDEAFSAEVAQLPTRDLLSQLWFDEMHGAPYYLLLHPWLALGTGEAVIRSLSVVLGGLAVAATYAVGKRYQVAFRAALLLAVLPFFIQYEQEARSYTMLAAASALTTLAFIRLTEGYTSFRAVSYIALGGLMIYVHPLGALIVAAHALGVLLFVPRAMRVSLLLLFVPIGFLWLPMARFMLTHRNVISWIEPLTAGLAVEHMVTVAGGFVMAIVALILIANGMRRDLVALWFIVPIVGTILISIVVQPMMVPRYMIGILPAAAILIARNPRWAIAGFVALSLVSVGNWYVNGQKDNVRGAAAMVTAQARPDDGVVFWPPYQRLPFAYYTEVGQPIYPSDPWSTIYIRGAPSFSGTIENPRVWVVSATDKTQPDALMAALSEYHLEREWTFGRVMPAIKLYVRGDPSP